MSRVTAAVVRLRAFRRGRLSWLVRQSARAKMAVVVLALLCAGTAVLGFGNTHPLHRRASSSAASERAKSEASQSRDLPQAGVVLGTLRFPVREAPLLSARAWSLFVLVAPSRR